MTPARRRRLVTNAETWANRAAEHATAGELASARVAIDLAHLFAELARLEAETTK